MEAVRSAGGEGGTWMEESPLSSESGGPAWGRWLREPGEAEEAAEAG